MKKRAKPVSKKAAKKAAKKPAARASGRPARGAGGAAKPVPPRTAVASRGPAGADRVTVEAARYTPGPLQSTGRPPFRYPPQ